MPVDTNKIKSTVVLATNDTFMIKVKSLRRFEKTLLEVEKIVFFQFGFQITEMMTRICNSLGFFKEIQKFQSVRLYSFLAIFFLFIPLKMFNLSLFECNTRKNGSISSKLTIFPMLISSPSFCNIHFNLDTSCQFCNVVELQQSYWKGRQYLMI